MPQDQRRYREADEQWVRGARVATRSADPGFAGAVPEQQTRDAEGGEQLRTLEVDVHCPAGHDFEPAGTTRTRCGRSPTAEWNLSETTTRAAFTCVA
jgi:hypothetical protein